MTNQTSGKELVSAGHAFAKAISMDTPLIVIAKMIGDLSTRLDCAIARGNALQQERDALAVENAILKNGIGFFSYGSDSGFEEHESAEKAIAAADSDIDYYRGDACDGWSEETDQTVWGVIMQRATVTGLRAVTEDDNCDPSIKEWCDYTLLPSIETPATDTFLNAVRAEGIHFAANRMLAAWDSGFIDDTPAQVYDISGAVLSAIEFLPNASPEEFMRDFADSIRREIKASTASAGKDGE